MQPTRQQLEMAGKQNLDWIEKQKLKFANLDLFKIFAYEIVQHLNHEYLKIVLQDENASSEN